MLIHIVFSVTMDAEFTIQLPVFTCAAVGLIELSLVQAHKWRDLFAFVSLVFLFSVGRNLVIEYELSMS